MVSVVQFFTKLGIAMKSGNKRKVVVAVLLFLLPTAAENAKSEYRYPFYCSENIAVVVCIPAKQLGNILLAYEGSPLWVTVDVGGLEFHKQRLTVSDQYYEIKRKLYKFTQIVIQSEGESTFDVDIGCREPLPFDFDQVSFLGNGIWLSENAPENYEIGILLPETKEKLCFYTLGLNAGEVWLQDNRDKIGSVPLTRYGPLTPTKVYESENRRDYEIDTTELKEYEWRGWEIVFTNLKGTEKFYICGDFENCTILVSRPRRFFAQESREPIGLDTPRPPS